MRKRFLLIIPVFQAVYGKPFANFMAMALSAASREHEHYELLPHVPEREALPTLMNRACEIVIEQRFDGIIVADDDCGPPFDAISQLLRRYEAGHQIVLGLGFMRNFPHTTTVGRYFKEGPTLVTNPGTRQAEWTGFRWIEDFTQEEMADGLVPVDFGGFPIALITREAIEKMERPWFGGYIDGGTCTHDVYFGKRAGDAKIPVMVDTNIQCGHLSEAPWITFENRQFIRKAHALRRQAEAQAAQEPVTV